MEKDGVAARVAELRERARTQQEINLVTALAFAVVALRAFEKHAFTPTMKGMARKYADAGDAALNGLDPVQLLSEDVERDGNWLVGNPRAAVTVEGPLDDEPPYPPDLAASFKLGCVAPDGTIWIGQTERLKAGIVQISEAEAEKAKRFGWAETGTRVAGRVYMERRS